MSLGILEVSTESSQEAVHEPTPTLQTMHQPKPCYFFFGEKNCRKDNCTFSHNQCDYTRTKLQQFSCTSVVLLLFVLSEMEKNIR